MLRRDQHIEQRHDVEHFAAVDQLGFLANLASNLQRPKLVLQWHESGALARQHHNVRRFQTAGDLRGNPGSGLARFDTAQGFFGQFARRSEAVAPAFQSSCSGSVIYSARYLRQPDDSAGCIRAAGMRAKAVVAVIGLGLQHHTVDSRNHGHTVAARVVAGQQVAAQAIAHKSLRCNKHLRLGTPKAVNALLGVADDKHTGRPARATPCAAIPT